MSSLLQSSMRFASIEDAQQFLSEHPDLTSIDLLIGDQHGVIRGKRIPADMLTKIFAHGMQLPASIFTLDVQGNTIDEAGLGMATGDYDRYCFPVANTLALMPWQTEKAQVLMTMCNDVHSPFFADPRHRLAAIVDLFDALHLTPVIAVELEFYLVDKERDEQGLLQPPISPVTQKRLDSTQVYSLDDLDDFDFFIDAITSAALEQGVPATAVTAENAPGQFEVNLHHQSDVMAACDHAVLLKRIIHQVARQFDMDATFMAKPYVDNVGSGMHVHISLLDQAGNNIFASEDPANHPVLKQAIAGILEMTPAVMPFLCPNVNSYRRLAPHNYAPNTLSWGIDNRSAALRIPFGEVDSTRIEHRISGADANPYLAVAAILAGIHHGLTKTLEPMPAAEGNVYEQEYDHLPDNTRDALRLCQKSSLIRDYFGKDFVDLILTCRWTELREFERHISSMEQEWLLRAL